MEEKHLLRKKWIRRSAVIFFAALIILTFFSNTIMNYSLPKVATQYVDSETVSAKVRGTGTIEAGAEKSVSINETRTVEKVNVETGSVVKKGDVLVTFTAEESEEIKEAVKNLNTEKESYDRKILVEEIDSEIVSKAENGGIDYNTSRNTLNSLTTASNAAKTKLDDAQKALDGYKEEEDEDGSKGIALQNAVAAAQKEYDNAVAAHDKYLAEINLIDELKSMHDTIKTDEDNLTKLREKSTGNELVSQYDGVVLEVSTEKGKTVSPSEPIISIANNSDGFTLSISVTVQESKKINVGDEASISNAWYFDGATAVVSNIKNDPSNPGKQKLVVFNLTGDLTAGESMTVTVGEKSQQYEYVVPNSSIKEDKDGKFVLIIKSKASPLGTRYTVKKIPVEVLASDDKNTAISGAIEYGDYVVTTSNKMIKSGDLVRLAD